MERVACEREPLVHPVRKRGKVLKVLILEETLEIVLNGEIDGSITTVERDILEDVINLLIKNERVQAG